MTPEQNSKLADLMEERYYSDFAPMISVFHKEEIERGILMWKRYLNQHHIRILHDSIGIHAGTPNPDEVVVQIPWYQGFITILAVPKELADKCLTFGQFPPFNKNDILLPGLN